LKTCTDTPSRPKRRRKRSETVTQFIRQAVARSDLYQVELGEDVAARLVHHAARLDTTEDTKPLVDLPVAGPLGAAVGAGAGDTMMPAVVVVLLAVAIPAPLTAIARAATPPNNASLVLV
jgi:hypothetical protein